MARPRSEQAREKMLTATAEIVFEHGVNAVGFDEVARRSGVAKTTIYRHFDSKNQLLIAALDQAAPFPPVPDTGTLRQDLLDYFAQISPACCDPTLRAAFLDLMAVAARDTELDELHRSKVDERTAPMRTIFERARERGELPADLRYTDAFDFLEAPFIIRMLMYPERVADIDVEKTVDRIIAALAA